MKIETKFELKQQSLKENPKPWEKERFEKKLTAFAGGQ